MQVPQQKDFPNELEFLREKERAMGLWQAEKLKKPLYFRTYNNAKEYLGNVGRGNEEPFKSNVWLDLAREEVWTVLK